VPNQNQPKNASPFCIIGIALALILFAIIQSFDIHPFIALFAELSIYGLMMGMSPEFDRKVDFDWTLGES